MNEIHAGIKTTCTVYNVRVEKILYGNDLKHDWHKQVILLRCIAFHIIYENHMKIMCVLNVDKIRWESEKHTYVDQWSNLHMFTHVDHLKQYTYDSFVYVNHTKRKTSQQRMLTPPRHLTLALSFRRSVLNFISFQEFFRLLTVFYCPFFILLSWE